MNNQPLDPADYPTPPEPEGTIIDPDGRHTAYGSREYRYVINREGADDAV